MSQKNFVSRRAIALLAAAATSTIAIPLPSQSSAAPSIPSNLPASLLERSYRLSLEAEPEDKSNLLAELTTVACSARTEHCREWSDALYRTALHEPLGWDRLADEKNALIGLSKVDPMAALEKMARLDAPVPMPNGSFPEDVRADAATEIFAAVWQRSKSKKTLALIVREADSLTVAGQYPYQGMAPIVKDIFKSDDLQAELMFRRAVAYYRTGSKSVREDSDFISMLDDLWGLLPVSLKRQALTTALEKLSAGREAPKGTLILTQAVSTTGSGKFTNRERGLIVQLLPKVRELDPAWEEQVIKDLPDLKAANLNGGKPIAVSTVQIEAGDSGESPGGMLSQATQLSTYNAAMATAPTDPARAQLLAASLNRRDQIAVYMAMASSYNSSDPTRATQMFNKSVADMELVESPEDKLRLLSVLANSSLGLGDNSICKDAVSKAYDLGEELIDERLIAKPNEAIYPMMLFNDLQRASNIGVRIAQDESLKRIEAIQTPALQALLLMNAAAIINYFHPQAENKLPRPQTAPSHP